MTCLVCENWGRTITRKEHPCPVMCRDCKRLTWPNLGVNCPAGSAVAFSCAAAIETMRQVAYLHRS